MGMEPGKLFIGGISWDTNEERLREYFQTFGEVVEAVIMKDRTTGRARGFGFVVFADAVIAESVVREKHIIDGRTVEAKKAVPRDDQQALNRNSSSNQGSPSPIRTKKIFVGGLASTITETNFKKYFDQYGTITDVVVMYDHQTQRPRGFGFITFDSEEAVDKVLYKNFHELNGKMVEVKRAVPKELSPGPSRAQLSGYNYGLSRVSSLLNAYAQGYNSDSIGGYGIRMDGKFSPVNVGRSGYPSFSPSGYGMGLNSEPGMSPGYGGTGNFSSNLAFGRGPSPFLSGNSNNFGAPGSALSSTNRNAWGNGSVDYAINPGNSSEFMGSGNGDSGMVNDFHHIGSFWASSPFSSQHGRPDSSYGSGNVSYGRVNNSFDSGVGGYGRNSGSRVAPVSSYAASNDGDGASVDLYGVGSFFGDPTWRSSSPELDGFRSFGYGLGDATADVLTKHPAGYVGGYGVSSRSNSGIAT